MQNSVIVYTAIIFDPNSTAPASYGRRLRLPNLLTAQSENVINTRDPFSHSLSTPLASHQIIIFCFRSF